MLVGTMDDRDLIIPDCIFDLWYFDGAKVTWILLVC